MISRLLPWSRTHDMAQHPSVQRSEHEGYVAYRVPGLPEASFDHRWVLDEPPERVGDWLERWRSDPDHAGVAEAMLAWEGRSHEVPADAPGAVELSCLMADGELLPPDGFDARRLTVDDAADVQRLLTHPHPGSDAHARWAAWWVPPQIQRDDAAFFGVHRQGELVAMCGIFSDRREARLQLLHTRDDHRRQGLAAGLVARAVHHYQEQSFGITYAAAVRDSPAESLLRQLGFRRTTAVTLVVG
jgi:GNAT superfamily N-acetyltransferase